MPLMTKCWNVFFQVSANKTTKDMKIKAITATVMLLAALCSCSKEGPARYKGNYSFKTSGTICARQISEPADTLLPSDVTIKLVTESGQMDITPSGGDAMLVTMNVTGGDMLVYNAKADGEDLVITADKRSIILDFPDSEGSKILPPSVRAEIGISGSGQRYDNIILFKFIYTGEFQVGNTKYEIYSSDIDCRAKVNE